MSEGQYYTIQIQSNFGLCFIFLNFLMKTYKNYESKEILGLGQIERETERKTERGRREKRR